MLRAIQQDRATVALEAKRDCLPVPSCGGKVWRSAHPRPPAHPQRAEDRSAWAPVFGAWCSLLAVESVGPGQCPRGLNTCGPRAQGRAVVPCVPVADWGTLGDRRETRWLAAALCPTQYRLFPFLPGEIPPPFSDQVVFVRLMLLPGPPEQGT